MQQSSPMAIARILDANLNRAREGLRTVEEWCRFGLNHQHWAEECKQLRQALAPWHQDDLRAARDTPNDVGTQLTHPQESQRTDVRALLQANLCRVQEALRVLEEYGKLRDPAMGACCKQLRYRVYALESGLLGAKLVQKLRQCSLYLVTSPQENLLATVEAALQWGLKLVQYRDKDTEDQLRWQRAKDLRQLCTQYGALFLVNDRVDLALAVNADGVHLGQQDLPIAVARQLLGPDKIIGRSTTNPEEMAKAIAEGADYIGVGPVYATPTKAGKKPAGLDYVQYAAANSPLPWFAIGGIDSGNLGEVMEAGANQVAIVRAIMEAPDPSQATAQLLTQLGRINS
ncbi:thiamine phosphate synthase [Synechocystis salina]|uniref:Thiamine-phosphate synthase n=1 Tax=Synechocystis salina LEGE 00031 TaxID=1828736 RepID=A0ABR9VTJ8_9SYNC|nr:thiamine phosphate synthase [Synechocystis salina]MBE9241259.1 thiamine phosphate synthase [Synechocystis salina LEGE 00041]MBE9254672.1 thiamine phosphate synthase [Synechocystis salina LEGE 00031]